LIEKKEHFRKFAITKVRLNCTKNLISRVSELFAIAVALLLEAPLLLLGTPRLLVLIAFVVTIPTLPHAGIGIRTLTEQVEYGNILISLRCEY
jgi:hypothetical protein